MVEFSIIVNFSFTHGLLHNQPGEKIKISSPVVKWNFKFKISLILNLDYYFDKHIIKCIWDYYFQQLNQAEMKNHSFVVQEFQESIKKVYYTHVSMNNNQIK